VTPTAVFGVTDDLKSHKCDFVAMRLALQGKWVFTELEASKQHEDPEESTNGNLCIDLFYCFVCQVLNIDCFFGASIHLPPIYRDPFLPARLPKGNPEV
jgi:hypothetical protein